MSPSSCPTTQTLVCYKRRSPYKRYIVTAGSIEGGMGRRGDRVKEGPRWFLSTIPDMLHTDLPGCLPSSASCLYSSPVSFSRATRDASNKVVTPLSPTRRHRERRRRRQARLCYARRGLPAMSPAIPARKRFSFSPAHGPRFLTCSFFNRMSSAH